MTKKRPSFMETVKTDSVTSADVNKHGGVHQLTDVNITAIELDAVNDIYVF